jgi:hypothetical protein
MPYINWYSVGLSRKVEALFKRLWCRDGDLPGFLRVLAPSLPSSPSLPLPFPLLPPLPLPNHPSTGTDFSRRVQGKISHIFPPLSLLSPVLTFFCPLSPPLPSSSPYTGSGGYNRGKFFEIADARR